jgi:hypothetical protein
VIARRTVTWQHATEINTAGGSHAENGENQQVTWICTDKRDCNNSLPRSQNVEGYAGRLTQDTSLTFPRLGTDSPLLAQWFPSSAEAFKPVTGSGGPLL